MKHRVDQSNPTAATALRWFSRLARRQVGPNPNTLHLMRRARGSTNTRLGAFVRIDRGYRA